MLWCRPAPPRRRSAAAGCVHPLSPRRASRVQWDSPAWLGSSMHNLPARESHKVQSFCEPSYLMARIACSYWNLEGDGTLLPGGTETKTQGPCWDGAHAMPTMPRRAGQPMPGLHSEMQASEYM